MDEKLSVAIVGTGMIADVHARAIAEVEGVRVVAALGSSPEKSRAFAGKYGADAASDLSSLWADRRVDVVVVCTPSGMHREAALPALCAGKHVLVEKPLEITVARAQEIIAAAQTAGVQVVTVFPSRFHPVWQTLREAVVAGRFGRLTCLDAAVPWYRTQAYYDSGAWRGTWELDGGGAVMNQGIHTVDLLQWIAGPVQSVSAQTALLAHDRIAVEDVACAVLKFASGALGTFRATTAAFPGFPKRMEIAGDSGSAVIEEERVVRWEFRQPQPTDDDFRATWGADSTRGGAADPKGIGIELHVAQWRNLVQALRSGQAPQLAGEEGLASVRLVEAIYRSARTGGPVLVDEPG